MSIQQSAQRVILVVGIFWSSAISQIVDPMPSPAPAEWTPLIGEYVDSEDTVMVLEENGRLLLREGGKPRLMNLDADMHFRIAGDTAVGTVRRAGHGAILGIELGDRFYGRISAGSGAFRIDLQRPMAELQADAARAQPPVEAGSFRRPDLVELALLDSTIHYDIRYATTNNFMGAQFYTQSRAFLQRPAALALVGAHRWLRQFGYGLLIHDAYRPWYVTKMFWDATPPAQRDFVANPTKGSKHNRGCAVDLGLYSLSSGQEVEMPSGYDEFSSRAYADFPGGTSLQRWHRALLRTAMERKGFRAEGVEWWHFDYRDWRQYPILNIRLEEIR